MTEKTTLQWQCQDRTLTFDSGPVIMGVLNVTPDSFSDGGRFSREDDAVAHALRMAEAGAGIIDVGGESTRPGAAEIPADEELQRVVPVIEKIAARTDAILSVDTRKAEVARRALQAGARIINDVSALAHDPAMADVAGEYGAGVILMHMRGAPATMQERPHYEDVVREVLEYLAGRLGDLTARGLRAGTLAVDPGIGFGKTLEHNLSLLARLDRFAGLGRPVVVGLSRKSFLGKITGRPVDQRLAGSLAALAFCVLHGAHVMRVHDVMESREAVQVILALERERRR